MIIAGSSLEILISIGEDVTGATAVIKYESPLGVSGSWTAEIVNAAKGTCRYSARPVDLDQDGPWKVWAIFTFNDGTVWKTAANQFQVFAEGEVQR